jgi:hypothetical protein
MFWRSATDGGRKCIAGTDAVATGCVSLSSVLDADATTELFDVSTAGSPCSQPPYKGGVLPAGPNCLHEVGIWQAWSVTQNASFVLLGDLSAYVSLSGYRFRLPAAGPVAVAAAATTTTTTTTTTTGRTTGEDLVVVGMPDEKVELTYLRKSAGRWVVSVQEVVIEKDGRAPVSLT